MNKLILQEHSRGFQLTLNNIVIAKASQYGKAKMIFVFNVLKQSFLISGLTVQTLKQYKTPKKELREKRAYQGRKFNEDKYYEEFKQRQVDFQKTKNEI